MISTPSDSVSHFTRPVVRRTHTLPDFPQIPPPPPSHGTGSDEDLGELATYPLRHSSAICKKTGGGRWYPKKTNTIEGYRIPGCKAQFEIDMEREEEELRRLKSNPVFKDGGLCSVSKFAFSVLLTPPFQISSIAYPVRSNLNPSEVSALLCFPLSDCFPAIDVSRFLPLFLGRLVTPRLYRTYAFHPCPFLCILVDVLFYSNTPLRVSLLYHHLCRAILVFICWKVDFPLCARSVITSLSLSCPQSHEVLESRTNGPCTPSTPMFGLPLPTIPTSVVARVCERQ